MQLTLKMLNYFFINHGDQRVFFILKSSIMSLSLSHLFEYLCYGSTVIIHIFTLIVWGSTLDVRIWRLQTVDVRFWRLKSILALLINICYYSSIPIYVWIFFDIYQVTRRFSTRYWGGIRQKLSGSFSVYKFKQSGVSSVNNRRRVIVY